MSARRWLVASALIALIATSMGTATAPPAEAADLPPGGTFEDDNGLDEEPWIEAIAAAGITKGCNPPDNTRFCPNTGLTRAQMASVFVRAFGLPPAADGPFVDTAQTVHVKDINALAALRITKGCNPPTNTEFCPQRRVTRGEMAAFIARAFDLPRSNVDAFVDDDTSIFEGDIQALEAAGIDVGCAQDRFCPRDDLSRAAMAEFIGKALDLEPIVPPPPPPPPYPDVGSGKRIIYSNSQQQVWMIDENEELVDTYLVSGRKGIPLNGTYTVYSKSINAWAPYGGITMKHMVRFVRPGTFGNQWAYGFHSIPRYPNGDPMQTEDELGYFRSGGCVRQADHKAAALYAWAGIGTTVHAIP